MTDDQRAELFERAHDRAFADSTDALMLKGDRRIARQRAGEALRFWIAHCKLAGKPVPYQDEDGQWVNPEALGHS
jgi:hypothetical protein